MTDKIDMTSGAALGGAVATTYPEEMIAIVAAERAVIEAAVLCHIYYADERQHQTALDYAVTELLLLRGTP